MMYEAIGKTVLYIIGTLLSGALFAVLDDDVEDSRGVFFGAWFAGIVVFLVLLIPAP